RSRLQPEPHAGRRRLLDGLPAPAQEALADARRLVAGEQDPKFSNFELSGFSLRSERFSICRASRCVRNGFRISIARLLAAFGTNFDSSGCSLRLKQFSIWSGADPGPTSLRPKQPALPRPAT